jgi:hypothetical protein
LVEKTIPAKLIPPGPEEVTGSCPFNDELDQLLWVLWLAREKPNEEWLSSTEVESVLLRCCGIHVPRQRILPRLRQAKGLVIGRKMKGVVRFKILAKGIDRVGNRRSDPLLVNPANAFSGRRRVQEIFAKLAGIVRICDPYVDPASLDFIARIQPQSEVRLLTMVISNQSEFLRDLRALMTERGKIEVRKIPDQTLHDRYVVDASTMYILGTSLNGLGKKQSIVVELAGGFRSGIIKIFDQGWSRSAEV